MTDFTIRDAGGADEAFLREMQYEALFVAPGDDPYPLAIVDEPGLHKYYSGFGQQAGDLGLIAVDVTGSPIGAAWVRQSTQADPGYGYVDDVTPELGIAVAEQHRGRGIGSVLLTELIAEIPRCSLSVDSRNPALRLYQRSGFEELRRDGDSVLMLRVGDP